jgi:molybdopterin adenylyltransferase
MSFKAVVITVSDSCYSGEKVDTSGPALVDALTKAGFDIAAVEIVPDEQLMIEVALQKYLADTGVNLILTTGGTGFSPRDVTPEATRTVIEKPAPGISELLRQTGAEQTPLSWTSRGESGIAKDKLIINLPGSPRAMAHSIEVLKPILNHALDLVSGRKVH